jgi:mannose-6-phosphate isomerase
MHKLKCVAQHYDWGQQGSTSLVGQIVKANCGEVKDDLPYAEYWMGSHVNGPSKVILESQEINLKDYLGLGQNKDKDKDKDQDLPFLFKVLSIKDALSIQAHPDKEFAEFLHENDPLHYKDDNHKPELAIAISDNFKLFYGMISEEESIKLSLKLAYLVEQAIKTDKYQADPHTHTGLRKKLDLYKSQNEITDTISNLEWYKELIKNLVTLNESEVQILINLIKEDKLGDHYEKKFSSFLSLHKRFGYDRGIIFSLFMNYMELKKGDALFIGPNIPHAYIEGDCIECMANSDNVIRLGLTPKFVDTENFLKVIYNNFRSSIKILNRLLAILLSK